jgi:uncharacterized sporulation protein YeaH/YhbH (DUF444 family)
MEAIKTRTPEEIAALKHSWKTDPCWDLYSTEGFEAHIEELKAYQEKCEREWAEKESKRLTEKATKLGIPDRLDLVNYLEGLEYKIKKLEERIDENDNG